MAIDNPQYFDNSVFSDTLKMLRQKRGLTLDQLSALTKEIDPQGDGVSRVALSRYENGASLPGLRELRLLSFALRCSLSLLVYDDGTDPMTQYRLQLEMRIMETVNDLISADALLSGSNTNDPRTPEYQALLDKVRGKTP